MDEIIVLYEEEDINQFFLLVTLLLRADMSRHDIIAEIAWLRNFDDRSTFPCECFTSKDIITTMIDKYEAQRLSNSPESQKKYIFLCYGKPLTLGYHLSFYFDVLLICSLHCLTCHEASTRSIQMISNIMINKYNLKHDYDINIDNDRKALTMQRIALCFPSITINACKTTEPVSISELYIYFPELPTILLHPYIIFVIPNLDYFPTALLIYIMIIIREYYSHCERNDIILYYEIIKRASSDNIFPQILKLFLCTLWNITKVDKGRYMFTENIITYSRIAKYLIRNLKSEDPTLELVLNMLY